MDNPRKYLQSLEIDIIQVSLHHNLYLLVLKMLEQARLILEEALMVQLNQLVILY
jgi:hypothetical protein